MIDIEAKPEITFDDFGKLQFQVGEIIACEEVKKSRKLLCSQVKIGSQVRQIVSGIKSHYSAEEMVGKKVQDELPEFIFKRRQDFLWKRVLHILTRMEMR